MRFASGEVQNLAGFVPSRMAERAAKTPGGACAQKVHSVLASPAARASFCALWLLLTSSSAAAAANCFVARDGAKVVSTSQRVTLATPLKLSDRCDFGLSPQGPWSARPAADGDFTSVALALSQPSEARDAAALGEQRPSSIFARPRATKSRRVGAADSGLQSIFLAGCTEYLMGPGNGFSLSVPVDTQRPTVMRTAPQGDSACNGAGLTLGFIREQAADGEGAPGAQQQQALRAGPWDARLSTDETVLALEPGRWAIYAGRGDAGLLVGRLQSGRSDSGLRTALALASQGSAPQAPWFRPTWASGHMQLEAASTAVSDSPVWAELRTAAAAGALWFADGTEANADARVLGRVRVGGSGTSLALPEQPLQSRMRQRYGPNAKHLVPTWSDWDGAHDGLHVCLAQRYDAERKAKVVAGAAVPSGAVCAQLAGLTAPLQARGGAPIAAAKICIKRHRHRLTIDGDRVGDPIGEHCVELPNEPSAEPAAFPIAATGDELLYSGASSAALQLCVDNHCGPMPVAGQWHALSDPGLVEIRHAPVPAAASSARGLSLLRIGVIDPAREWHPVGLVHPQAGPDATTRGEAQNSGDALVWGTLDHDAPDTFAYVRRQQRMDFRLSLSPTLVAAWNGQHRGSSMSRHVPVGARVEGGFGAPDESTFVVLVTREDSCPEHAAGDLQPGDLVDPDSALVGERFFVHLGQYQGDDVAYRCIASAGMAVTPRLSMRAGDNLRVGLLGDVQAVMFVMPRAALGVAVPLAYARYHLAHGLGIDASGSLTVAASIDGPHISRAGLGLSSALYWGPEEQAPALLSMGVMLHAAAATHRDPPIASLFAALNLSTLLDLAGGR